MSKEMQTNNQKSNTNTPWYTSKLKGIPVEPGQDLRHVSKQAINEWFMNLENRWREQYNRRRTDGHFASMSIGRG